MANYPFAHQMPVCKYLAVAMLGSQIFVMVAVYQNSIHTEKMMREAIERANRQPRFVKQMGDIDENEAETLKILTTSNEPNQLIFDNSQQSMSTKHEAVMKEIQPSKPSPGKDNIIKISNSPMKKKKHKTKICIGGGYTSRFGPDISAADIKIKYDRVYLRNAKLPNPEAVRYAWKNNPKGPKLYNSKGLPASPFLVKNSENDSTE